MKLASKQRIEVGNHPVDTGRKLNVHKTFRRRPESLLNVLCTSDLRAVSTGQVTMILELGLTL